MDNFNLFVNKLLINPLANTILSVLGKRKKIKAMARFTSKNYPQSQYIKIVFDDHSFLFLVLSDKEIHYSDKYIIKTGIPDEDIGEKEIVHYLGETYKLVNKDDYQFCLQLYVGSPLDIEGECRFSDYFPVSGEKEYLSLGWVVRTGKRVDINAKIIRLEDVKIVD